MREIEQYRMSMTGKTWPPSPPATYKPFYAPARPVLQPMSFEQKLQKLDAFILELFSHDEKLKLMWQMRKMADRLEAGMPTPKPQPGDDLLEAYRKEQASE